MVIGSMNDAIIMLAAICFPILFGAVILLMPEFSSRNRLLGAVGTGLLVTGILALLTLRCGEAGICLFSLGEKLEIFFRLDNLGRIFIVIVTIIWILAGF